MLLTRCIRGPRAFLVAWTLAIVGLAVALGAQALGHLSGYGAVTFRAMEIGAQALAPFGLCLGLVAVVGRSLTARFALRLVLTAIAVVMIVILAIDPLSPNAAFSKTWPDPRLVYQVVPQGLIEFFAIITSLIAVVAVAVEFFRSRRAQAASQVGPVLGAAAAVLGLAIPGISWLLHKYVYVPSGKTAFALICTAAAALTWRAAVVADRRNAGDRILAPQGGHDWQAADWPDGPQPYDDPYAPSADDRFGLASYRAALGVEPNDQWPGREEDRGYDLADGQAQHLPEPDSEIRYPALAALAAEVTGEPELPPANDQPPLFGQITIYTLVDGGADEFDRVTGKLVRRVQANEPDVLAYIVHAVPTSPLQRILYEVYRDQAAYNDHMRQAHVVKYEMQRRPFVLGANVVELGLQQAKVSPFPLSASLSAISDFLTESGLDLTGVTKDPRGSGHAEPYSVPSSEPYPAAPGEPAYDRVPGYDRPSGFDRGPGFDREPGPDREPGSHRDPLYDRQPGLGRRAGFGREAGFDRGAGLDREPGYDREPGLHRDPPYDRPPVFDGGPGLDREPGFGRGPGLDRQPGFGRGPGFDREPGYDREPGWHRDPGFDRQPGYDPEPSHRQPPDFDGQAGNERDSGYDFESDDDLSYDLEPGYDHEPSHAREPGHDGEPGHDRPYQGWADIRGDESKH